MASIEGVKNAVERFIMDPANHDILMLVKAIRNGLVYGTKIRFPHALVMVVLFRTGTVREKLALILKATRQHARNLASFAFIYKATMLLLRQMHTLQPLAAGKSTTPRRSETGYDSLVAGALGGYFVFGRRRAAQSSVNQQIVIYVFARSMLGLAKLALQPGGPKRDVLKADYGEVRTGAAGVLDAWLFSGEGGDERRKWVLRNSWAVFASASWAAVMWLFRWHPDVIQPSLRSSMKYIYDNAEEWDGLKNFLWHNK